MKIMYKCRCLLLEREVEVPERPRDGDLIVWVQYVVGGCVLMDHSTVSPYCKQQEMEYVKIPVDENAEGIGQKPHLAS